MQIRWESLPTPVSALIHAATLVTAGIYLMVRLGPFWSDLVIVVGSLTALMAGVFGFFQADIKRVIAFSTCSQLGYNRIFECFNRAKLCGVRYNEVWGASTHALLCVPQKTCAAVQRVVKKKEQVCSFFLQGGL